MIDLYIRNLNAKRRVDIPGLKAVARTVLIGLGEKNAAVSIVFVSNQKIRAMNRKYLGKDLSTDVIAWPCQRTAPGGPGVMKKDPAPRYMGDIAISSDKAARNAGIYGESYSRELALYVIHGILHLKGFEDKTRVGREKMRKKEEEFLEKTRKRLA